MSTLTVYNRHQVDASIFALHLADDVKAPITTGIDERNGATFTTSASVERLVAAGEFWLPCGGWGVTE